ncbi:MAG TPA: hypothetical protein VI168_19175 [Croceibacterium sp.]
MTRPRLFFPLATLALAACGREPVAEGPSSDATENASPAPSGAASPPPHAPPDDPPAAGSEPLAASLIRAEWAKSRDRAACGPLAFTTDGGAPATARRAEFSGGWGVAFDTPQVRSAYGVAGPGVLDGDAAPPAAQAERLGAQWPHFTTLANLPAPAFAGYGVEGAQDFPADNPDGRGLNAVAYVRVGGERCTYNVWSRLGRAHLEVLLGSLRAL